MQAIPRMRDRSTCWRSRLLEQPAVQSQGLDTADRTLLFSTDYPHWDNGFPHQTLTRIAPDLRRRIFFENAAELFHLT